MKKIASLVLALIFLFAFATAEVAPEGVNVFVSITDDQNNLALAYEPVFVTDQDNDGLITIADALACAHASNHENGKDAFSYAATEYGLSLTMLWGVDNGGSYGYMVNDLSSLSLSDLVNEGDHIKAYCFTDLVAWSDTYSFFTFPCAEAGIDAPITASLMSAGYDASWNPVTLTVADAIIYVNGEATEYKTDESGQFTISFAEAGRYVLTAKCDHTNLVAPVCVIDVK